MDDKTSWKPIFTEDEDMSANDSNADEGPCDEELE
jgi:hypothetical protein